MEEALAEPSTSNIFKNKLGNCEVCGSPDSKYTCPRCEVKTCSLKCCQIHKMELECTGKRDKTKYIPLEKFTNLDLLSDYRLLEEATSRLEAVKKKRPRINDTLPIHLHKLRHAARQRQTYLRFLPKYFSRHRENSTRLNFKSGIISWQIEWIFVNSDNFKIKDENVPEDARICSVLEKYLGLQEDRVVQEKLQFYQAVSIPGIRLLLKGEGRALGKFYEVDPTATLKECLRRKTILECPIIHVILRDHIGCYEIIDSDNEDMANGENSSYIEKIVRMEERENKSDNYLFSEEL